MHVSWVFEGKGGDRKAVADAEAACTALTAAVRDAYGDMPTDALVALLGAVQGLRLPMVTDGRTAVEHGDEWSAQAGGILVRLSP
jgi:hypothetical protein